MLRLGQCPSSNRGGLTAKSAPRGPLREKTSRPVVPRLQRNILRIQWHGRSETIGEYGRRMESVTKVPEEASA